MVLCTANWEPQESSVEAGDDEEGGNLTSLFTMISPSRTQGLERMLAYPDLNLCLYLS